MGSDAVPRYGSLPFLGDLDVRHAWDVWGPGDALGTLNHISDRVALQALRVPRAGTRIDLTLPIHEPDPPLYGRPRVEHRVFARNRNMIEDELVRLDPQASSQWDGLRHIKAREHGFYGGVHDEDADALRDLGIHRWLERGIVTRGVLVDLVGYWDRHGIRVDPLTERAIPAAEILAALADEGTELRTGDLLLVRTGWLDAYRREGPPSPDGAVPLSTGLEAGHATAELLWDARVCAVAADNPAVEVLPGDPAVGSLHRRMIPALGMPLGELWNLDGLAAACAAAGRWECCVVSVPLHVVGGVASPANAVAIL